MNKTPFFRGVPRWRKWDFWLVLLCYLVFVIGYQYLYLKSDVITLLAVTPLYLLSLLPSRSWIGENHIFIIGRMKVEFHKFERINEFSTFDWSDSVTLDLARVGSARPLRVDFEIERGAELERFVTEMKSRNVFDALETARQDLEHMMESFQTFSPPYEDAESEREALYRFINRPKPESKNSTTL